MFHVLIDSCMLLGRAGFGYLALLKPGSGAGLRGPQEADGLEQGRRWTRR
jgi:hypothetical protein